MKQKQEDMGQVLEVPAFCTHSTQLPVHLQEKESVGRGQAWRQRTPDLVLPPVLGGGILRSGPCRNTDDKEYLDGDLCSLTVPATEARGLGQVHPLADLSEPQYVRPFQT
jgi:hypothetical protein